MCNLKTGVQVNSYVNQSVLLWSVLLVKWIILMALPTHQAGFKAQALPTHKKSWKLIFRISVDHLWSKNKVVCLVSVHYHFHIQIRSWFKFVFYWLFHTWITHTVSSSISGAIKEVSFRLIEFHSLPSWPTSTDLSKYLLSSNRLRGSLLMSYS